MFAPYILPESVAYFHFFPDNAKLGLAGIAWTIRLCTDLFQIRFSFQNDRILLNGAEHIDFQSARIQRNSSMTPAEFPISGE